MRLLLIEDEEKTSTYMSGFIASTPPGQEVMPIMGWVCRLCAPSLLCTGEMPLPVVKVASIHLASPLRCKRIKRRTIRLQTLSLELTIKVTMRHLKLKQGVCGMATHTREIHQCSSHY